MAHKFELTEPAKSDLKKIWSYIAEHNPSSADRALRTFKEKFQMLAENPKLGKSQNDFIINLCRFPFKEYVIFYFPTESGVEIYRVLHSSRNIEDLFENYFEGLKP
jgi:toxin ParE1/3/4